MIDVIIPNYNGSAFLPVCLDSLRAQTRCDFTVTVVDDASTDDSVALIKSRYPEVQVFQLDQNRGFAAAVNAALTATHQPFVALLNNDTEADPHWLAALIGALERWSQFAFAASKLGCLIGAMCCIQPVIFIVRMVNRVIVGFGKKIAVNTMCTVRCLGRVPAPQPTGAARSNCWLKTDEYLTKNW